MSFETHVILACGIWLLAIFHNFLKERKEFRDHEKKILYRKTELQGTESSH